jgi:hypothetical protein
MDGSVDNLPYGIQWLGLAATLVGTGLGAASLVWAIKAAVRAKSAREMANQARAAAVRAGRVAHLSDLIADMQELQAMLARCDFLAIAGKANLLRGRIVRFKAEAYNELGVEEKENLDLARGHLEGVAKVAATSTANEESKAGRVQLGYGNANEALNKVVAIHRQKVEGD